MKRKLSLKNVVLFFLLLCFFYFVLKKTHIFERMVSIFVYPFVLVQYKIVNPLKEMMDWSKTYKQLYAELLESHAQRQELLARNLALHATLLDMQECQEMVDFKKRYLTNEAIVARVLLTNIDDQHHYMLLDAGSVRGVQQDMVVVHHNCLVGRIVAVYPYYSRAILITDKTCKVAGMCVTTQAHGIHEGMNMDDETRLTFVSHLEELQHDDLIISTGEGLIFPRGFGLGRIHNFERDGFSYRVTVQPLLDFSALKTCCIFEKGAEFQKK
ncbi:MAG: rod shape-determining protein MreC [Candidatus Babeliaceae bacterium]